MNNLKAAAGLSVIAVILSPLLVLIAFISVVAKLSGIEKA